MLARAAVWRSLHMLPTRLQVFVRARQKLGEILSAFEFFDQQALDLTLKHLEGVRNPLPDTQTPFYLVVETSGSNEEHDNKKLQVRLTSLAHVASRIRERETLHLFQPPRADQMPDPLRGRCHNIRLDSL